MGNKPTKTSSAPRPHDITFHPARQCRHPGCTYQRKNNNNQLPADALCQFTNASLQCLPQKHAQQALDILTSPSTNRSGHADWSSKFTHNDVVPFLVACFPKHLMKFPQQRGNFHTFSNLMSIFENGAWEYYTNLNSFAWNFSTEQNHSLLHALVSVEGNIVMEKLAKDLCFVKLPQHQVVELWKTACVANSANYMPAFMKLQSCGIGPETRRDIYMSSCRSSRTPPLGNVIVEEFQDDLEVVTVACTRHGHALQHASARLKNNKKLCLLSLEKYGSALEYCSNVMKKDRDVVRAAVQVFGVALRYADPSLQDDPEIALVALLSSNGAALSQVSRRLQLDRDLVRTAISLDGRSIRSADSSFCSDPITCGIAVASNPWSIEFIGALHNTHPKVLVALACRAVQCEWRGQ